MRHLLNLSVVLLLACAAQAQEILKLAIPSGYLPPDFAASFESRFHAKLVIDFYEDPENALAKIQSGGPALYDVVVTPDYTIGALVRQNLLAPLDHKALPNLKNLAADFQKPAYDPELKHAIPFQWGTVGIYARKPAGKPLDESWGLFFDPARQPGPFVLLDSMRDTIGAALKFRGHSFNATQPKELKEARDLLVNAKGRALEFANSPGARGRVLDKSAAAAIVYSTEGARGMAEDSGTCYFLPKEGSEIWIDNMTIMAQAPHAALALQFINYVLEPETGAAISNFALSASPNAEAQKLIKPDLLHNPAIYPPPDAMKRLELLKDLGRATRIYDQVWTSVKAE
jgi:spermidine/putrescine transport system substrate-binding protein